MTVDDLICMAGGNTKIKVEHVVNMNVYYEGTANEWIEDESVRSTVGENEFHSLTVVNETDELVIYIE